MGYDLLTRNVACLREGVIDFPYRTATYSTGIQQRRKFMQSSYLKEKSKRMQLYANQPADNREYRFLPGCKQEQ